MIYDEVQGKRLAGESRTDAILREGRARAVARWLEHVGTGGGGLTEAGWAWYALDLLAVGAGRVPDEAWLRGYAAHLKAAFT